MTVYVVLCNMSYDGKDLEGVFLSEEAAAAFAAALRNRDESGFCYVVEAYEVKDAP